MKEKDYVCPTIAEFKQLPIFDILLKEFNSSESNTHYVVYNYPYFIHGEGAGNRSIEQINDEKIQNAHISNITDGLYGIELSIRSIIYRGLPSKDPDYTYLKTIKRMTLLEDDTFLRNYHPEYHPKNYYPCQSYPVEMHYAIDIRTGLMTCINENIPFEIRYCQTLGHVHTEDYYQDGIRCFNELLIYDGNFNCKKMNTFSIFSFFKKN